MLGAFISADRTEQLGNFMPRGWKTHRRHKATDRGEVRGPAQPPPLRRTPLGLRGAETAHIQSHYHPTAPKPRGVSHKTWFPNYFTFIVRLETVIRPSQGLLGQREAFAPLAPPPEETREVSNGEFAEPGVPSYACPSSTVQVQTLTGCHMAQLPLSP